MKLLLMLQCCSFLVLANLLVRSELDGQDISTGLDFPRQNLFSFSTVNSDTPRWPQECGMKHIRVDREEMRI